jgi:hypothetical protein
LTSLAATVVEVEEVLTAFELTGVLTAVADEEAALQVALPHISLNHQKDCTDPTYR